MYQLVAQGHVFVAQPPLLRVSSKKNVYYVQTEEEMKSQLLDRGLSDAVFDDRDGRLFEGDRMKQLCATLAPMDEAITALGRRGAAFTIHAQRLDPVTGPLPVFPVFLGRSDHWLQNRGQIDELVTAKEKRTGKTI